MTYYWEIRVLDLDNYYNYSYHNMLERYWEENTCLVPRGIWWSKMNRCLREATWEKLFLKDWGIAIWETQNWNWEKFVLGEKSKRWVGNEIGRKILDRTICFIIGSKILNYTDTDNYMYPILKLKPYCIWIHIKKICIRIRNYLYPNIRIWKNSNMNPDSDG